MEVEIGYFPKYYYSSQPDAGGHFPFAIEGNPYMYFQWTVFICQNVM
ncbi:hypothetical protein N0U24_14000 [Peribacillus frigoritolerans]|nr:hypothetical protein [Peribacillus frigoritolerans]MCT4478250.1 hypothetical protein [Peribacillus frigoritolerans]